MTQVHSLKPTHIQAVMQRSCDAHTHVRLLALLQKVSAAEFVSDADVMTLERAEWQLRNAQVRNVTNVVNINDYRRAS